MTTSHDNKESLPSTDTPGLVLPITYSPLTDTSVTHTPIIDTFETIASLPIDTTNIIETVAPQLTETTDARKVKAHNQANVTAQEIHKMFNGTCNVLNNVFPFQDEETDVIVNAILDTSSVTTKALNASLQAALKSVFTELDTPTAAVDPNIKFFKKCQALRQYAFLFHVKQCNELSTHAYVGWDDYDVYDYDDYDAY